MDLTRRKFVGGAGLAATGVGATAAGLSAIQDSDPTRCEGEPVSVEKSLTDASGYDDGIRYFSGNDTIRYVRYRDGDGPVAFETESFENWASGGCAKIALSQVREATPNRLGSDEFGSGLYPTPKLLSYLSGEFLSARLVPILTVGKSDAEADGAENRSSVDFSRLIRVAPQSAHATISLDGETFSRTVAVFAEQTEVSSAEL
jgi:hypothetical protein